MSETRLTNIKEKLYKELLVELAHTVIDPAKQHNVRSSRLTFHNKLIN